MRKIISNARALIFSRGRTSAHKFCTYRFLIVVVLFGVLFPLHFAYFYRLRGSFLHKRTANGARALIQCPLRCARTEQRDASGPAFTRLAVIRPYIDRQMDKMSANIKSWEREDLFPCERDAPIRRDKRPVLVLYFNRRGDENPDQSRRIDEFRLAVERLESVRTCFDGVELMDAGLTDAQDQYFFSPRTFGYVSAGTCNMFYPLFKPAKGLRGRFSHFLYTEPDMSALRSGWLDALESLARHSPGAWMVGSVPLYNPDGDIVANVQWTIDELRGHLNGNALYKLGDQCFDSVLCRTQVEYKDEPFDMSIHAYTAAVHARTNEERQALYGHSDCALLPALASVKASARCSTERRLKRTHVIGNVGSKGAQERALMREMLPDTFLVHGAWFKD